MNLPQSANSQKLVEILTEIISNSPQQRITFAQYMALALYHQDYGYYSSGKVAIGNQGDFFTAASLGQDFGELLAVQFLEMWHHLHYPQTFTLVEMGAGNGDLAADILNYLHNTPLQSALEYIIVETSPALQEKQQQKLANFAKINLSWKSWSDFAEASIVGCCFSNELVDAFPVHLIVKQAQKLQEVYLELSDQQLRETVQPILSPGIAEYFELIDIDLLAHQYSEGYRTEVNLQALEWLNTIALKLKQGYILTIDYGYNAAKYYQPARRQGTLQCYLQHRRHHNPYVNPGTQDLTAHVNFTALERQGHLSGLETLGFTEQGLFLMALGLGDRLNELSNGQYNFLEILQRRDALHQLINPTGLGNFKVLIQGKNLAPAAKILRGLTIPEP